MTQLSDLGVLGLAVMGANPARNAARKGFGVALYNRHGGRTDDLVKEFGHDGRFTPTKDLKGFVASLCKRRVIIIMCKSGKPVDDVIDELGSIDLRRSECRIVSKVTMKSVGKPDAGNRHVRVFTDTERRFAFLKEKKVRFIGMGVSGGEQGALEGPSM